MPTLLSDLINAIPVAGRGDVISFESHNSIRDAIVAIVTELGGAVASRNVTLTFTPTFLETSRGDEAKWIVDIGGARSPAQGATNGIAGWLPLQLPHGSRIQQLRVAAGRKGPLDPPSRMDVSLQRQRIRAGTQAPVDTLANVSLSGAENLQDFFERNAPYSEDPLSHPPAPRDIVDNDEFKYFARAHWFGGAPNGSSVNIFEIMVDCRLG
jgi:hypothetical protein